MEDMANTLKNIAFSLVAGAVIGYLTSIAFGENSIWPYIIGIASAVGFIFLAFDLFPPKR
jgi:uncharacterized membrane protein YoaK (UPF0700 family)